MGAFKERHADNYKEETGLTKYVENNSSLSLFLFAQSSSDYISPYEMPLVAQAPTNESKESESPPAGNDP